MIRLSSIIEQFEDDFLQCYGKQLLPSQRKALAAMKMCRSKYSPMMKAHCEHCDTGKFLPHSCGNRHCPHCQHHESQQWLENQCRKHVHIHAVIPAAAIDKTHRLWREKKGKYLFNHKALAKVFRAKLLEMMVNEKLKLPNDYPKEWVVDCKFVGSGEKALIYLGRYLYRGVLSEKNILSCQNGNVTFRYLERESKTNKYKNKTFSGAHFLWLILQHVLPRRFRRARNYGFLHPNSKRLITLLKFVLNHFNAEQFQRKIKPRPKPRCSCCGITTQMSGGGTPSDSI